MKKSNANQNSSSDNPVWYFLAELSLSEFLSDYDRRDDLTVKLLFHELRELDIPTEYLENIEETVAAFAKEKLIHFKYGKLKPSGRIRVFCQKKVVDRASLSRAISQSYPTELGMEQAQMILDAGTKMNGGWGYYLIDRGRDFAHASSKESCPMIELYVYKEGI